MKTVEENLIGYVLGALDEDAHREVEEHLRAHPGDQQKVENLRQALEPLAADREEEIEPPSGLVISTLAMVAEQECKPLPQAPKILSSSSSRSWWRRSDVAAACFLLILLGGLGTVWLFKGWQQSDLVECQSNLREIHAALVEYAKNQPDTGFPRIEKEGPLSFAGAYVPMLRDNGALQGQVSIACPVHGKRRPAEISCQNLKEWYSTDRPRYERAIQDPGGSYAYSLGYWNGNQVRELTLGSGLDMAPILADCPSFGATAPQSEGNSMNHRGEGQNVLFVGGHVRFCRARNVGINRDDIYLNQKNRIQAGLNAQDTVLGASSARPMDY